MQQPSKPWLQAGHFSGSQGSSSPGAPPLSPASGGAPPAPSRPPAPPVVFCGTQFEPAGTKPGSQMDSHAPSALQEVCAFAGVLQALHVGPAQPVAGVIGVHTSPQILNPGWHSERPASPSRGGNTGGGVPIISGGCKTGICIWPPAPPAEPTLIGGGSTAPPVAASGSTSRPPEAGPSWSRSYWPSMPSSCEHAAASRHEVTAMTGDLT